MKDNSDIVNISNNEKEKINVLYLINYAGSGGSEAYLKLLFDNVDVNHVLCYNVKGKLVEETENRNIECINLKMLSPFDFIAARKLSKIVKKKNISIIHTQYLRENYIAILSKLFGSKAKIVYTCHFNQYDNKLVTCINKIFYRYLTKVISISNAVTDSLIKSGCPKLKIELVYHGVKLKQEKAPIINYKEKFGVNNNDFVISSGSRFSPEKGNEFLIRSLKKLKGMSSRKFKVLLANKGETYEKCRELVEKLKLKDEVKFVGYLDNIQDLYLASDVYVTTSQSEGLGLATLESLSFGVPNVVTAVGGLKDIVNDYTLCGIAIPYGDEAALATAIYKLMNDSQLKEQYSENAKKVIEEKFSLEKMIRETIEVYKDALIPIDEGAIR